MAFYTLRDENCRWYTNRIYVYQAFFWTFRKKLKAKKNSSRKKLKQIIRKLNILPTGMDFFLLPKALNSIDLALKFIQTKVFLLLIHDILRLSYNSLQMQGILGKTQGIFQKVSPTLSWRLWQKCSKSCLSEFSGFHWRNDGGELSRWGVHAPWPGSLHG